MKSGKKWIWGSVIALAAIFAAWLVWIWIDFGPWARNEQRAIQNINGKPFLVGEFQVKVKLPLNPVTRVRYLIPVDAAGKPLPSADNMVFYAPFNGEDGSTFLPRLAWLNPFWEEHGFTVFSLSMAANTQITGDVKQYYIFPECGWYPVITAIQEHICREFSIPQRPFFIAGESAGGSLAQRMCQSIPERISAAAWCGATRPGMPQQPNQVPIMALNTWGCPGTLSVQEALRRQRELGGTEIRHGITPPHSNGNRDYHAAGEKAYALIRQFIVDAARSRDTGAAFPSEEFQLLWSELPHAVTDAYLEPENASEEFQVYPPRADADRVLFLMYDPESVTLPVLMDALQLWAGKQVIPVVFAADNRCYDDPGLPGRVFQQLLERPEWRLLPIYVAGVGVGGQMAAVAALQHPDPRLAGITTLDAPWEYPFEHLSIATQYGDATQALRMIFSSNFTDSFPDKLPATVAAEAKKPDPALSFPHPWGNFISRAAGFSEKNSQPSH